MGREKEVVRNPKRMVIRSEEGGAFFMDGHVKYQTSAIVVVTRVISMYIGINLGLKITVYTKIMYK